MEFSKAHSSLRFPFQRYLASGSVSRESLRQSQSQPAPGGCSRASHKAPLMALHLISLLSPWLGCMNYLSTEFFSLPISRNRICFCPASSERIYRKQCESVVCFLTQNKMYLTSITEGPLPFSLQPPSPVTPGAHFLISLILDPAWPSKTLYLIGCNWPSCSQGFSAPGACWHVPVYTSLAVIEYKQLKHAGYLPCLLWIPELQCRARALSAEDYTLSLHPPMGVREALACGLHLPWKGLLFLSAQVNYLSSSCAWG